MQPFSGPLVAFISTVILIMLFRPTAVAMGLVDVPNVRKSHDGEIPLVGGLAILLGLMVAMASFGFVTGNHPWMDLRVATYLIVSAFLVGIGAWDDLADLSAYIRFGAQIIAALAMIFFGGVVLTDLGFIGLRAEPLQLGILAIPFTVFATLGVINAVNMSDGLDGLSGSLALVSLVGLGIANIAGNGEIGITMFILTLSANVAGCLLFNLRLLWRNRASVFLGDAGSMFLGLSLCWLAIGLSQGESRAISPAVALWFLMVPIFDAVSMMARRMIKRRSPFEADREHLHHVFLMAGFTVNETVGILAAIAFSGVIVGLGGMYFGISDFIMAGLFAVTGLLYLWVILRAWTVMRFLRRSICRRRNIADRRMNIDRRQQASSVYAGAERRSGPDRRQSASRRALDRSEPRLVVTDTPVRRVPS